MITRQFGDGGWKACAPGNPPPLHVADTESAMANWHPLPRPFLLPTHPGPLMVLIPGLPGNLLGEDPTDPGAQLRPRVATPGMQARLNVTAGSRGGSVGARGERR